MKFGKFTYNEFIEEIDAFHGTVAPEIIMGGSMVNYAVENLPEGIFFDVICEVETFLPDAIQLLTPCSVGNGGLRILDLGRFAVVFYDKYSGLGVRVYIDIPKLDNFAEVKTWFLKLKQKDLLDSDLLLSQIKEAGTSLFGFQKVQVDNSFLKKTKLGKDTKCPICSESYPMVHGSVCKGCKEKLPYNIIDDVNENQTYKETLILSKTPLDKSVGKHLLHDITRVIKDKEKGVFLKRGHKITKEDLCDLTNLGKNNLYLEEYNTNIEKYTHEDAAVLGFAKYLAGEGVSYEPNPREGKIDLFAQEDGLLVIDSDKLERFNLSSGVICATLPGFTHVKKGDKLAGTRAIPLYISNDNYLKALSEIDSSSVLAVMKMRKLKVGILTTGTEIYKNLIKDTYQDILKTKVEKYGCYVVATNIVPDDIHEISSGINKLIQAGAEMIITTAGLSVDPDDVTLEGIIAAGAENILYGAPVLPGCLLLLANINDVQIVAVPACGVFNNYFSFDLILPRLLANIRITREDLAKMGEGGLLPKNA